MELLGELSAIWRYPVKSLAAQPLESTRVEATGIPGDRSSALHVRAGHAREGKTYRGKEHNLLHTAHEAARAIAMAADHGVTVALESDGETRYFDDAPLSLIFDRWIAKVERALAMPLDPRRWRPNFYARASRSFMLSESELVRREIALGDAILRVRSTIERCVTTTYDVATGVSEKEVLGYVARQRNNVMGVYCEVELAGTVRVGDVLRLRAR